MNKLYNEKGEVAVIVSHDWGAGWSTWGNPDMVFSPDVAQAIVDKKPKEEIRKIAEKLFPEDYLGGIDDGITVYWLKPGTKFKIEEFDGNEDIVTVEDLIYTA